MPTIKTMSAVFALLLVSACASLSGETATTASIDAASQLEAVQAKSAALEVQVSRLKSENARLTNQLLGMQREHEQVAANDATNGIKDTPTPELVASKLPSPPQISVPDPQVKSSAVVEGANAPEIVKNDVPVESSPRLVQPTFASTEEVFENEAGSEIQTASVLYGVHLASYRKTTDASDGWRKLQREYPDELGLLEPRVETVTIPEKGVFLRLIGGGFSSTEKAAELCSSLKDKGLYCSVSGFKGDRLSLSDAG